MGIFVNGIAYVFADIEIGRLLIVKKSLLNDPLLAEYRHYLEKILRRVPHIKMKTNRRRVLPFDLPPRDKFL
jgi:oligoendopeptidase F